MPLPFWKLFSILHHLPPEMAHHMSLLALKLGLGPSLIALDPDNLHQTLWGRCFTNPLGLGAGFDKNAEVIASLFRMGFGFVEVGSICPKPQKGNPKPRLFRLSQDQAIINRMGFNSKGHTFAKQAIIKKAPYLGPLGINLGKNKESSTPHEDYKQGLTAFACLADYIVINISSPNTPGLRDLQEKTALASLLKTVKAHLETHLEIQEKRPPILVKIAPDLTDTHLQDIIDTVLNIKIDGLIISNTTIDRPQTLQSTFAHETGGLSGKPLFSSSTDLLRQVAKQTQHQDLVLIGTGGISNGQDAYDKILSGAHLVQLYSALIYQGPQLVNDIKKDLSQFLKRDGFSSITQARGQSL